MNDSTPIKSLAEAYRAMNEGSWSPRFIEHPTTAMYSLADHISKLANKHKTVELHQLARRVPEVVPTHQPAAKRLQDRVTSLEKEIESESKPR